MLYVGKKRIYILLIVLAAAVLLISSKLFKRNTYHYIFSEIRGNVISFDEGTSAVIVEAFNQTDNQLWKLIHVENDVYYMENKQSKRYLSYDPGSKQFLLDTKKSGLVQKWEITGTGNKGFFIINSEDRTVFDDNGKNIIPGRLRPGAKDENWFIVPFDDTDAFFKALFEYITDAKVFRRQAWNFVNLKMYEKALELMQKGIRLDPAYANNYSGMGKVYLWYLKDYEKAAYFLEEAIKRDGNDWSFYVRCAQAHEKLGNYERALELCLIVVGSDFKPEHKQMAYEQLARLYYFKRDFTNSLKYAELAGPDSRYNSLLKPRKISFSYDLHLKQLAHERNWHTIMNMAEVKVMLPINSYYQRLLSVSSKPAYKRIIRDTRYNYAVFDFSNGFPEHLLLDFTVANQLQPTVLHSLKSYRVVENEIGYYANLKSDYYDLDNRLLQDAVKEITKGQSTVLGKMTAIRAWISSNIRHIESLEENRGRDWDDYAPTYDKVSEVYKTKKGHCAHISALFIAMCRIVHIPARMIAGTHAGHDIKQKQGPAPAGGDHNVVEIYNPETRCWYYIDPQTLKPAGEPYFWHVIITSHKKSPYDNYISPTWLSHHENNICKLLGIDRTYADYEVTQDDSIHFEPAPQPLEYKNLTIDSQSWYTLTSVWNKKSLTVNGRAGKLALSKADTDQESGYKFISCGDGFYYIQEKESRLYLELETPGKNASPVILAKKRNKDSQKFALIYAAENTCYILNKTLYKCLSAHRDREAADGKPVVCRNLLFEPYQQFIVLKEK